MACHYVFLPPPRTPSITIPTHLCGTAVIITERRGLEEQLLHTLESVTISLSLQTQDKGMSQPYFLFQGSVFPYPCRLWQLKRHSQNLPPFSFFNIHDGNIPVDRAGAKGISNLNSKTHIYQSLMTSLEEKAATVERSQEPLQRISSNGCGMSVPPNQSQQGTHFSVSSSRATQEGITGAITHSER